MAGSPPSPCASHSEVSGRVGTRKFDQMRIKICFSPIKPLQILQRPVRLLVPNLCSYKRLANGAVKIISAKRILAFDWSMEVKPRYRRVETSLRTQKPRVRGNNRRIFGMFLGSN